MFVQDKELELEELQYELQEAEGYYALRLRERIEMLMNEDGVG